MLQVLACGVVLFPGLFFTFRKVLPSIFKHWTEADVVLVSERSVRVCSRTFNTSFALFIAV